ncbi:MAG: hypothetical protein ACFCGT_15190 [Sandaracinaceae bacterium]
MDLPSDLTRPLRATARRVRLQRAVTAGSLLALPGLGVAAVVVALAKLGALPRGGVVAWLAVAAALPALGALVGLLRPLGPLLAAKLLDRSHGLHDRVSNAVSFAAGEERTAFMAAAIRDAATRARELSPRRAMPLSVPRELGVALALALAVVGLGLLEVRRAVVVATAPGDPLVPVVLGADDLEAFDREVRDLLDDPETPEPVRTLAEEVNRLIEDLADQRLDRAESLRRVAELEARIGEALPADREMLRESLRELGTDLRRSELASELAEALRDADAERGEAELRRLAERLRGERPDRADLEALRRALRRAAEAREDEGSDELARLEEEQQRLLRRQQDSEASPAERRLLRRRQRELERLRREHREAMEQARRLERLQRELEQAAEDLRREAGQERAADALSRGAEELNRMAREQMSEEELERMARTLRQLREMIRRMRQEGGQGGEQQAGGQGERLRRFVLRASGEGGARLLLPGGQQGRGQQGQGGGEDGQGQSGQQQGQGPGGQGGQARGGEGESPGAGDGQETIVLGGEGPTTALLEIPGMGAPSGLRDGQGEGQGQQRAPGAGVGHSDERLEDPNLMGGQHRTVRVEGESRGEGPSRSEVIRSSAQRGFARSGYRRVYTDYRDHAEEVLERDEVPPGYRFYVRRYFQLIRPREQGP